MVEADIPPVRLAMAGSTLFSFHAPVRIVAGVTVVAGCGFSLLQGASVVAGLATEFAVFSTQRELGVGVVIETGFFPACVAVAILTLGSVAAGVYVVALMAVDTGIAGNLFHIRALVAALAAHLAVRAQQFILRVLVVVEAEFGPLVLSVA